MEVYVDDPVFAAAGPLPQATEELAIAILFATVLGFPLAWKKCDGGQALTWIGAHFQVSRVGVLVTLPQQKIDELTHEVEQVLRQRLVSTKRLRSLAGSLSFVASLIPPVRPFLRPLWAVLGCPGVTAGSLPPRSQTSVPRGAVPPLGPRLPPWAAGDHRPGVPL